MAKINVFLGDLKTKIGEARDFVIDWTPIVSQFLPSKPVREVVRVRKQRKPQSWRKHLRRVKAQKRRTA